MRTMRFATRVIATVLVCAFLGLGAFLGYTVYTQSSRWVTTQYNTRLTSARKTVGMGSITDRNGMILAETDADGERQYADDKVVRRALSQTVGDQLSMSGTGVETFHAGTLLGLGGSIIDRTWQYVTGQSYKGDNIRLTVDAELTAYIAEQFPAKHAGAVALINYRTGEVLAMVSKPDYDPQKLLSRQSGADESGAAYLNRCLQGQYAPGSSFKIVTLAAALENLSGIDERTFVCDGPRYFGDTKVTCYGGEVHGTMTLAQALEKSCNVTFASIAEELGDKRLAAAARKMGFNDNFRFRDLVLYQSSIPDAISDPGELAWTGDGQGKLLVTPLHMALLAGAVANGGTMQEPRLIAQVTGAAGGMPRLRTPTGQYARVMERSTADTVARYMRRVVESGTATKARIKGYTVCGKTGTAEVSDDKRAPTNAWFVGFVAEEDAPYAIAVVVEGGGTGGSTAAPLAAKALKRAIALQNYQ